MKQPTAFHLPLGGGRALVTQQRLDHADVDAVFEEVNREMRDCRRVRARC